MDNVTDGTQALSTSHGGLRECQPVQTFPCSLPVIKTSVLIVAVSFIGFVYMSFKGLINENIYL